MTGPITLRELAEIDVGRLRGVGERKREALSAFDIENVLDLVTTYPRRWVDRTNEARIEDLVTGDEALVLVTVRSVAKRMLRNRRTMVTASVGDGTGRMQVVFFNQPWRERQLTEGLQVALFGKAEEYRGGLQMTNPIVDLIGDRTGRIVAIYPQSEKVQLSTWELAGWIENALERCRPRGVADPVPDAVRRRLGLIGRGDALRSIHLPETMREKEAARRRLAFDELLRVQLVLVMRKRALEHEARGLSHTIDGELVRRFHDALPYPLTGAQLRMIAEISADLAAPHPMHRLLQGDVGSGKTVVAVSTMLTAVQGGHQGALDGADRGARRAAREQRQEPPRRGHRPRSRQPVRRPAAAGRAAHQPGRWCRPPRGAGGPRRRHGRHRDRHARADPGGCRVPQPRVPSSSTSSTGSGSSSERRCATSRPAGCPTCS